MCSSWCVSFTIETLNEGAHDCTFLINEPPSFTICNRRDNGFLDGKGTFQTIKLQVNYASELILPKEYEVLCDGFNVGLSFDTIYKPEYGHKFKVTGNGGPSNNEPLYEKSKFCPSFI